MKIFKDGGKVNFVDENNVFVGYDLSQDCCEDADWFISEKENDAIYPGDDICEGKIERSIPNLEGYTFDTSYFKEVDRPELDDGGMAIFKLSKNGHALFLHLYNSQNGYYSHGFESNIGGQTWKEGTL